MGDSFQLFLDTFTFDKLMMFLSNASIGDIALNPFVLIPLLIIIGLISYPKTTYIGQNLLMYIPAIGFLFITGVILKNDSITNTGPFIMAMVSFFMIIGWFIWTKLLGD